MRSRVVFRADGNSSIGLGHIYRCCAIAQMLECTGCQLVTEHINDSLKKEISKYFDNITEIGANNKDETGWMQKLEGNEIVVLDGYSFDAVYQKKLKARCRRMVCIDDIYSYPFYADAIINHAGGLHSSVYQKEDYTRLYLGPAYAMVRAEFWNKPSTALRLKDHVFVCLGGADPCNDLVKILEKILPVSGDLIFEVVTGSAYRFDELLKELVSHYPSVRLHKNLDAGGMCHLMQQCSIGIVSPSTVSYEYLSIGGELYLYPIADNQESIYQYFINEGLAFSLEDFRVMETGRVENMIEIQGRIFDGKSYLRIKDAILNG